MVLHVRRVEPSVAYARPRINRHQGDVGAAWQGALRDAPPKPPLRTALSMRRRVVLRSALGTTGAQCTNSAWCCSAQVHTLGTFPTP